MTCTEVNEHLDQMRFGQLTSLPEAVLDHLRACARCRALWEFFARNDGGSGISEGTEARIRDSILQSLEPVSPLPSRSRLTIGFLMIFGIVSAAFIAVAGMRGASVQGWVQFAGMLGVLGAAAVVLAFTLSQEMVPGERRLLSPGRLLVVLAASLFLAVLLLFPWSTGRSLLSSGWHCFSAGFLFSIPAAGLIVWSLRRGLVLSPGAAGAAAGLLAGVVGATVLHFGCSMHTAPHIALGHLGVALVGAVLGYLIGHYLPLVWTRFRSNERST